MNSEGAPAPFFCVPGASVQHDNMWVAGSTSDGTRAGVCTAVKRHIATDGIAPDQGTSIQVKAVKNQSRFHRLAQRDSSLWRFLDA